MTADLVVCALWAAIARRRPDGVVIVHADRGSQFRARSFRAVLAAAGLKGSMGRVASAADHAAMESFWSLLQKNVLNRHEWRNREELEYAIVYCIEHTYSRRRRQRALGKLTPVEFEQALRPRKPAPPQHDRSQPESTEAAADPGSGACGSALEAPPTYCQLERAAAQQSG
jgi:putative transposase